MLNFTTVYTERHRQLLEKMCIASQKTSFKFPEALFLAKIHGCSQPKQLP
jgi:hypothetical protein